jgi:maltose O-acetyltransferase
MGKLRRVVAAALYYAIARHLPPSNVFGGRLWKYMRVALVRGFADHVGSNVDISRNVYLGFGRGIRLGSNSGVGIGAELHGPLHVGDYVMISPQVIVHTRNHSARSTSAPITTQGYEDSRPVVIDDDVWIGVRAILLPGITIGRGSIIGAGAVVSKDVPEYSVAVGNPARVVRSRLPGQLLRD